MNSVARVGSAVVLCCSAAVLLLHSSRKKKIKAAKLLVGSLKLTPIQLLLRQRVRVPWNPQHALSLLATAFGQVEEEFTGSLADTLLISIWLADLYLINDFERVIRKLVANEKFEKASLFGLFAHSDLSESLPTCEQLFFEVSNRVSILERQEVFSISSEIKQRALSCIISEFIFSLVLRHPDRAAEELSSSFLATRCDELISTQNWCHEILHPTAASSFSVLYNPISCEAAQSARAIASNTQCLFAPHARVWGSRNWDRLMSFEENIACTIPIFARFMAACVYEHLDGFAWQLPVDYGRSPEALGRGMKRLLKAIAKYDPQKSMCMDSGLPGGRTWQFIFEYERIFVTSFAPCYTETHCRFSFGVEHPIVLFQPERSFAAHKVPLFVQPGSIGHRIRDNFASHGRPYPSPTKQLLMAHIYGKHNPHAPHLRFSSASERFPRSAGLLVEGQLKTYSIN
jgi:hypothetical protein